MSNKPRRFVQANAFVLLSLVIGIANNVIIASVFGLTHGVDAFFAAVMLPNLFMILCVDYLGKNFLPALALARQEGATRAAQMTSTIVTAVFLISFALTALSTAFSGPLFALLLPGFNVAKLTLVTQHFMIVAPAMVLMAVSTFHEYCCQIEERFVTVVAIRMALPLANLLAILLLGPYVGEYCLPIGYLAGHVVVFVLMAYFARYRFRPRLTFWTDLERRVFTNSAVVMSTGFVARSMSMIMNFFASTLGEGVVAALAIGTKLTEPLRRTAFYAARMFMFSRTARLFASGDSAAIADLYRLGLRASFLLLAPVLWWMAFNVTPIVEILFGRGEFTPQMVVLVASILLALTPSVLFLGVNQLLSNAFYGMNRVLVPAIVMPLGTVIFAGIAGPLSNEGGAAGLALSTTIVAVCVFLGLYGALSKAISGLRPIATLGALALYVLLGGAAAVATDWFLRNLGLNGIAYMLVMLPLSGVLYLGVLSVIRDRTFCRLVGWGKSCFGEQKAVA